MKKTIALSILILLQSLTALHAEIPTNAAKQEVHTRGEIGWLKRPVFDFNNAELGNQNREVAFKLYVLTTGEIKKAELVKSSGITQIDQRVERSLLRAKFKPYIENGVAYPFVAVQPFSLTTTQETEKPWWKKLLFIQ